MFHKTIANLLSIWKNSFVVKLQFLQVPRRIQDFNNLHSALSLQTMHCFYKKNLLNLFKSSIDWCSIYHTPPPPISTPIASACLQDAVQFCNPRHPCAPGWPLQLRNTGPRPFWTLPVLRVRKPPECLWLSKYPFGTVYFQSMGAVLI